MLNKKIKDYCLNFINTSKEIFFSQNNLKKIANKNLLIGINRLYNLDPESFLIIEIGANDGIMNDRFHTFISENDPHAILIEPIEDYYNALVKNYQNNKNSIFVNTAIDIQEGNREMHFIPYELIRNKKIKFRMEKTPELLSKHWAMGLGTFHPQKNNISCPELLVHKQKAMVQATTFEYLIDKYDINKYKNIVLQTDCEGHDYNLLKSFPFNRIRPKVYISEIYSKIRYPDSHPNYTGPGGEGYIQDEGLYTKYEEEDAKSILLQNEYNLFRDTDLIALDKFFLKLMK